MNNKLNGFTVPSNMNPTQQKIENPEVDQSPLSKSEIGETLLSTVANTRIDPSETITNTEDERKAASSSAEAISNARVLQDDPKEEIHNVPIESNLSMPGALQFKKLEGAEPSAGYGTEILPFAV